MHHAAMQATAGGGGGSARNTRVGGGGGGGTRVTYFAEEVFLKTSVCPRFCKREGYFFVTRYEVWG